MQSLKWKADYKLHDEKYVSQDEIRQGSQQSAAEEGSNKTGLRSCMELSLGSQVRERRPRYSLVPVQNEVKKNCQGGRK